MLLLLLTLLLPDAAARCARAWTSDELKNVSRLAMARYGDAQMSGFYQANAESIAYIPCLGEVLRPDAAAVWYQVQGVQAFLDRRSSAMESYFQVARFLDPSLDLDERVAPPGHPIRVAWENALLAPPFGDVSLVGTVRGDLYVDGLESLTLPAERPFVGQLVATNGVPSRSAFVVDAAEAPPWMSGRSSASWSRGLSRGAAVSATLAAGLWIATGPAYVRYAGVAARVTATPDRASSADMEEFRDAARRTNALGIGAQAATVAALGLGGAALVVRF